MRNYIAYSELVAVIAIPSRRAAVRQAAGDHPVAITAPDETPATVTRPAAPWDEAALLDMSCTT
ncbi:hypothetical protein [Rhodopila sp.]|uniref:hypothetical protein n=1 Tax=Rhodopila sp. TaxID=2480087 RepID=UPI003D136034